MVALVSWASRGSTSMETRPSWPPVFSKTGARVVVYPGARHGRGPADVVGGDGASGLVDAHFADRQVGDLLVVAAALGDGGGED
jgi:hypothetical protein